MHFDFVDIGTCDFDTSLDLVKNNTQTKILLVEPLKYYLDKLPNLPNVIKDDVGISDYDGTVEFYYLPEDIISKYQFKMWTKGCSVIGHRHPSIEILLKDNNLPLDLIEKLQINVITFHTLCEKHDITSIGSLKIDTEGHEKFIIPSILEKIEKGFYIHKIKFEHPYLEKNTLENFLNNFMNNGFKITSHTKLDYILENENN